MYLRTTVDFLKDGLFREWAYFLDFENQTLEIWKPERREAKMVAKAGSGEVSVRYILDVQRMCEPYEDGDEEEED